MAKRIRIYWDACTWLAIVNEERAVPQGGGKPPENRFSMCQNIIERAENDEFEIVVSAFTLAEVCKSKTATTENPSKLPAFLDHDYILVVPVDKDVALKAQTLQTSGLFGLKPADAVHIASAQRANVTEIHSFDGDFLSLDGQIAANNGNAIKICKPGEGTQLGGLFESGDND
ncbi:type II toxin-antitoxin system VapC family toxin [Planktotalea sp.]|uniref:type II toxin-antitoxin system VapC family toxin n=1 Tax=Planktotalea sp. TaxID=2029877 RepID=UPI003D6C426F